MASHGRRETVADGQLAPELRRRDLSGVPLDRTRHLAALLTGIGPPCWASSISAGAAHGFDGCRLQAPFHVLVPRGRNVQRAHHVIHTSDSIPLIDQAVVGGIATTAPTRTLIDMAAHVPPEALTVALDGALRDGLTWEDHLHRRIDELRGSGRPGIRRMLEVLEGAEIVRGGQSWLEREFLRLLAAAGLPRPRTQVAIGVRRSTLIRVDFWFDGTPLVVETLGYRWHRTGAQMAIDAERMNRLVLDGFVPLQYTYGQVVRDGAAVVEEVRGALRPYLRGRTRTS